MSYKFMEQPKEKSGAHLYRPTRLRASTSTLSLGASRSPTLRLHAAAIPREHAPPYSDTCYP